MPKDVFHSDAELKGYLTRNSPEGLLMRYARGRVRSFAARQVATVLGAGTLAALVDPVLGLIVALAVFLGDLVDSIVLGLLPYLRARGWRFRRLYILSALTAGVQALTIGAAVLAPNLYDEADGISFFCMSFLAIAAANGGVVLQFHRLAGDLRLGLYGIVGALHFFFELAEHGEMSAHVVFDAVGMVMIAFMISVFVAETSRLSGLNRRSRLAALERARDLELAHTGLEQSEQNMRRLALVAQNANDIVIIMDAEARITWVNAAFTRDLGYTSDEAIGRRPNDFLTGPETDPEITDTVARDLQAGRPARCTVLNYRKDGAPIWLEINVVPVQRDGVTEMLLAVERDVTEARRQARALEEARRGAEQGARAKAAFLATMSHEIRTPMNAIVGLADVLSDTALDRDQQRYLGMIRSSSQSLLQIINDVLDLSRLDSGKPMIVSAPLDLDSCLRDAVEALQPQAQAKGLTLEVSRPEVPPPRLMGDAGRLRQIVTNLVGNAIKFTERGHVRLTYDTTPAEGGHDLCLRVSDTGIGIPPDRAEAIFDIFEQAQADTGAKFGGTGLGLSISRQLARQMGGELALDPDGGPGAAFVLTLCLPVARDDSDPAPDKGSDTPRADLTGLRVLLAEDNRTNQALVRAFLGGSGVRMTLVEDGAAAVRSALSDPPDIILMDMSMPVMSGLEATARIRETDGPQPRIIALTANAFASDKARCLAAGMDDFLSKPVRKSELLAALARAGRA